MTIKDAISRSASHTEIVHLDAADKAEAEAMIHDAMMAAVDADLEFDHSDANEGHECWAGPEGTTDMTWRLNIRIA